MPTDMPAKPVMPSGPAAKRGLVWIIGLLGLTVGLIAGYGAGRVSTGTPLDPQAAGGYQQGYEAAKRKLADSGLLPPAPSETRSLAGILTAVDGDILTLDDDQRLSNPLNDAVGPKQRRVTVGADTRLVRLAEKSQEAYGLELAAFDQALRSTEPDAPPPTAPSPFTEVPIALKDLKAGDRLTIAADHDISIEAAFTATLITLVSAAP